MRNVLAFILTCIILAQVSIQVEAKSGLDCNCVLYARSYVPELPRGLYTKKDKQGIVNYYSPVPGAILLTGDGYWGHAAYVDKVEGDLVFIQEANFSRCKKTTRWIRKDYEKIYGYYLSPILLAKVELMNFIAAQNLNEQFGRYAAYISL